MNFQVYRPMGLSCALKEMKYFSEISYLVSKEDSVYYFYTFLSHSFVKKL